MNKYARYNNIIGIIVDDNVTKTQIAIKMGSSNVKILVDKDKVKVANTPQELIEIGDLYQTSIGDETLLLHYKDNSMGKMIFDAHKNKVTKILTPNSNGGYDKQWEVE